MTTDTGTTKQSFTAEERAAMKERAKELKGAQNREAAAVAIREKIDELDGTDRELAEQVHRIVTAAAPGLMPTTWYGMPSYNKDGKSVVFFKPAGKFKARYATLGFNDSARLDDGTMWPTEFALTSMTGENEQRIAELVRRAAAPAAD